MGATTVAIIAGMTQESTYASADSSGKSGRRKPGLVNPDDEQEVFVTEYYEALLEELAQGQGAGFETLAGLMGCSPEAMLELRHVGQATVDRVVTEGLDQPERLLPELKREMRANPALSTCSRLG
jgi:hypothetical protein